MPECTEHDWKCVGVDLYECLAGKWQLVEPNSPQCYMPPPPPPEPEPIPTDEELIYANWLRTGGTGSISYWRSIGSPLYYTPPKPEPAPEEEAPAGLTAITAPNTAKEGEKVSLSAKVTNISADSYVFRIKLLAVRDIYAVPAPDEKIGSLEVVIKSGQSQIVSGSFIMPAWDAIVLVMVERLNSYWDLDHYTTKIVSVVGVEYPATDIKDIIISVVGVEYPATDIKDIIISVVGPEYPATDIKDIIISVIGPEYPATDIKDIIISVIGVPIPPEEEEEEEEKKFPWVPAALIAGGVGLMIAGGIETKKAKGG